VAGITQRESGKWEARVRRRGGRTVSKTFSTKTAAFAWARAQEAEIERGTWVDTSVAHRTMLKDLLREYTELVAAPRGSAAELGRLARFVEDLGHYRLDAVTPAVVLKWRDQRLKAVAPGTVARELGLLGGVLTWARKERLIPLPQNPVSAIAAPATDDARDRRLAADEEARLLAAMADQPSAAGGAKRQGNYRTGSRQGSLKPIFQLALETAMRQGELLALEWQHIDLQMQTAFLPTTKNGESRGVPLSRKAVAILEDVALRDAPRAGRVFPITADALKKAWVRSVKRARARYESECAASGQTSDARLTDLRFHDLRHEATSRLAEKLPNLIELAAVTGHRDLRMLKRYYHPRASDLAKKLG
jgi:integrase